MSNFEERIDPELLAFLNRIPNDCMDNMSLEELQEAANTYCQDAEMCFQPDANILIKNRLIPRDDGSSLKVRIYQPVQGDRSSPLPALLWFHEGGFFMGALGGDDKICQTFALKCQCVVVSVDYRLAPQHPFPAGFDDCYTALLWLSSLGVNDLDIDSEVIVIGGLSAGGCLAAGLALRARDENGPDIKAQILIIPVLDDRHETPSSKDILDPRVWNRELSLRAWTAYLKNVESPTPMFAAPSRADDLRGLPPTFISVEEQDLLRDEAMLYAQRLMQSGVSTEHHVYPGTFHGSILSFPDAGINKRHMSDIVHALKKIVSLSKK